MNRERFERVLDAIRHGRLGNQHVGLEMSNWADRVVPDDGDATPWALEALRDLHPPSDDPPPCRTTLCLAGWAATLAGDPPRFERPTRSFNPETDNEEVRFGTEVTRSGELISIVAARWLDMNTCEQELFHAFGCTTADELAETADEMADDGLLTWTEETVATDLPDVQVTVTDRRTAGVAT